MSATLPNPSRVARLNSVPNADPVKANLTENEVHKAARLLRQAIAKAGLTHQDAMDALGETHKGQFSEKLDGLRKLWAHQLLRPQAAPIRKELLILSAVEDGVCEVERTIRIKESA